MERWTVRYARDIIGDFGTGGAPSVPEPTIYVDPDTVKRVQAALGLKVDGIIGPKTRAAVKDWNEAHDNASNGSSITDKTLATLPKSATAARAPVRDATAPMMQVQEEAPVWWAKEVPVVGRPLWQVVLGAVGLSAMAVGAISLFGGSKRRRR